MARGVRCGARCRLRRLPNRGWADRSMRAGVGATAFGVACGKRALHCGGGRFGLPARATQAHALVCRARRASSGEPRRSPLVAAGVLMPVRARGRCGHPAHHGTGLAVREHRRRCEHVDAAGGGHGDHRVGGRAHHATSRSHGRLQGLSARDAGDPLVAAVFRRSARRAGRSRHDHVLRRVRHGVPAVHSRSCTHVAHVELCAVKRVPGRLGSVLGDRPVHRRRSGRAQRRLRAVVVDAARVRGHLPVGHRAGGRVAPRASAGRVFRRGGGGWGRRAERGCRSHRRRRAGRGRRRGGGAVRTDAARARDTGLLGTRPYSQVHRRRAGHFREHRVGPHQARLRENRCPLQTRAHERRRAARKKPLETKSAPAEGGSRGARGG